MDGWTYGQADGHLRPTLLGRLGGVDHKHKIHRINDKILRTTYEYQQLNEEASCCM